MSAQSKSPINPISKAVSEMSLSGIMEMEMRAAEVEGVASLAIGLPSFATPPEITRPILQQLADNPELGKYTLCDGLPELRHAVADFHLNQTGLRADPDKEILITAGNMQGLNLLLHILLDPGDEVIVTDPGFPSHIEQIRLCGGSPVFCRLDEADGWRLDPDSLNSLISDRTRAVVLVSPHNPTGRVFTEEELMPLAELAVRHGFMILLDDPYSHFNYDVETRFSLAGRAELAGHMAYLYSFSKAHAMTGWRLGYMVVPPRIKSQALKVHDATLICAPRISQIAGLYALASHGAYIPGFCTALEQRRYLTGQRLKRLSHVFSHVEPQGAYYVFPSLRTQIPSQVFAEELLNSQKVLVTPGSCFGPSGEHHIRLAFCVSEATIGQAFDRLDRHFTR
jgi:aspartate/methionine/tyrosine aminotransferase